MTHFKLSAAVNPCGGTYKHIQKILFMVSNLSLSQSLRSCPNVECRMMNRPSVSSQRKQHCSWTINPRRKVWGNDVLAHPPEMSHPDAF